MDDEATGVAWRDRTTGPRRTRSPKPPQAARVSMIMLKVRRRAGIDLDQLLVCEQDMRIYMARY